MEIAGWLGLVPAGRIPPVSGAAWCIAGPASRILAFCESGFAL